MNTPTYYTLNEYDADWLESPTLDVNGDLMVFETYEAAQDMARWMLEGGTESLLRDGQLPLVTILGHDGPPGQSFCTECGATLPYDGRCADHPDAFVDDYAAYACGWVEATRLPHYLHDDMNDWFVTAHDGDYENDEGLWARMPAQVNPFTFILKRSEDR